MTKLLATDGEGERLDRFELVAELASGGMATVYLARLSGVAGFQRLVAIKRLHPHLAKEPDFVEMFLDEARLAARIHHPNVVPIQEVGESKSGFYLVMDYVEGDTLARLLGRAAQTKTQIPWGVTIRILLDTLAGLHAAHELTDDFGKPFELVHRDISPQNILVGSDGIARITDFGVARAASRLSTTRSGQLKGKLAYMAPEQARAKDIDRRADIFACGIVLWEALALKRLFKADGEAATLERVLHDPIPPPSTHRPEIPAGLEAVCMKALQRDIDQRFATAEEFADELERVARAQSCVGSVRDVAACLEDVFGNDLMQQREAVRAWLARSEPTGPPYSRPPPRPAESAKTRVEGGSTSSPPDKVSSVSSAVLQGPAPAPEPKKSPARVAAAVVATGVAIGTAAWLGSHFGDKPAPPPPTQTRPPPPPAPDPPASHESPTPPASSSAPPPSPVRTPTPALTPARKPEPSASPPDDLSKNPYR
jgi:serine/threonine-protein kinase